MAQINQFINLGLINDPTFDDVGQASLHVQGVYIPGSLSFNNVVIPLRVSQTQTNTNEQGIYVVKTISSTVVLERADDQQCIEQLKAGQYVSVGAGSVGAGLPGGAVHSRAGVGGAAHIALVGLPVAVVVEPVAALDVAVAGGAGGGGDTAAVAADVPG